MLALCPQGAHITRKRGVYQYRRRLPAPFRGELSLTLATRRYREAEHRAALIDRAFGMAWSTARKMSDIPAEVRKLVRDYLKHALDADHAHRLARKPGATVFALGGGSDDEDPVDADLDIVDRLLSDAQEALAHRDTRAVKEKASELIREHGLSEEHLQGVAIGLLEANVEYLKEARKRTVGEARLILLPAPIDTPPEYRPATHEANEKACGKEAAKPPKPQLSELIEGFVAWRRKHGAKEHLVAQERPTMRFFRDLAGDKPVDQYLRKDVTRFLEGLSSFPAKYGRSPADRELGAAELIARAERDNAERLSAKTVKRHLSTITQFFKFCVDESHITRNEFSELTEGHKIIGKAAPARRQRDAWTPDELTALFKSPVWTGSHPTNRSQPGEDIIRDAKFWLPLLALFQGARLEELADLYRRDIGESEGVPTLSINDAGRDLKNANAVRLLPIHPELIRLGFLDYVQEKAPAADDPLFPDLKPGGPDNKRGPRFTRWFVNYRQMTGLYRPGVGTHAFRHVANTRLRDTVTDVQQLRHIEFLFGHSGGGGEGRERYDKGPGLRALATTLSRLQYPEIDLSHLYVHSATSADPKTAP